jgi:aspartate 1-decarboxylase
MAIEVLRSKIHRARVTDANLDYDGSFTIDSEIMKLAGILPYQAVEIYNVTNGSRLKTYAISGEPSSRTFCANGAAAHHIRKGDIVIICSYAFIEENEALNFSPVVVKVNENNEVIEKERTK